MASDTLRVIEIEFEPLGAPQRRLRFIPNPESGGYLRVMEERDGDSWREIGHEMVTSVECVVSA
jgi:hypothetical protein